MILACCTYAAPRDASARQSPGSSRTRSCSRAINDDSDPDATTGPLSASLAAAVMAYERGATVLRVHDVRETVEALTVAEASL